MSATWNNQPQCAIHGQQYLELPLNALCTLSGEPHKGQKSYMTKFYEKETVLRNVPCRSLTLECGCMCCVIEAILIPQTLICSYNIGLTLINPSIHNLYVQLSNISSPELRLLHLNQLIDNFRNDPDVSLVPQPLMDLMSYRHFSYAVDVFTFHFCWARKASIMKHIFQNAWFQ